MVGNTVYKCKLELNLLHNYVCDYVFNEFVCVCAFFNSLASTRFEFSGTSDFVESEEKNDLVVSVIV